MNSPLKWLYHYNKKHLWAVLVLSVISAAISGSFILLAVISKKILDIAVGTDKGSITSYCILLIGTIALQAVFNIINANVRIRATTKLEMNMRQKMFSLLLKKQYTDVKQMHSGEILNRFTSDIDIIVSGLISIIPQFISIATKLVGGLTVLLVVDGKFTFLVFGVGLFVMVCSRLYSRKFRYLHKEVQRTNGTVRAFIQECIENIIVIKSFVNERPVQKKLDEYQQENYQIRKKRTAVSNVANTAVYVMFTGGYYTALVWGAMQMAAGQLTFGTITAFLQILDQMKTPFRNMSGLIPQYYSMVACAERLMELEGLQDEVKSTRMEDIKGFYEKLSSICLEHAVFAYEDEEIVLEKASLQIEKGVFTALVGPSGIGKSTLIKLLLSLVTLQKGRLYMKTEDGEIDVDAGMRSLFSYVPQGNLILSGTIRENIAFGRVEVSDAEVIEAAKIACIWKDIEEMPERLDTVLGERGIGLSEGQAQRIAIARAVLNEAPIMLMDECTSALDGQTEEKVLKNLKQLKDRTIICVSHKDAAMKCCDQAVRLENKKFKRIK